MEQKKIMNAEECERIYQNALMLFEGQLYSEAASDFARIPGYKDADEKKLECENKAVTSRLDDIYAEADKAAANSNVRSQEKAIQIFQTIHGYKDADERIEQAKQRIREITEKERTDREEAICAAEEQKQKKAVRRKRIIRSLIAVVLAAAFCVVGVILFRKYAVPAIRYDRAVRQFEEGELDEAYRTLHGMNYRDSDEIVYQIAKQRLQDAEVGSTVLFGFFTQGMITSEEKDPIEWIVLEKDGSKMLLISKYALDSLPFMRYDYDPSVTPVSWNTSLLRDWLNHDFLDTAFDSGELRIIKPTVILDIQQNGARGSEVTDKVFVLSANEAKRYFRSDESRKCTATQYALGYGAYHSSNGGTCLWWLRTPVAAAIIMETTDDFGYNADRVACVSTSGEIISAGHDSRIRGYAVRPAIWVDLEATGD